MQLKDILKEKWGGNFLKLSLFMHENAPAHRALASQKKLEYLCFQIHDHSPYSPQLAPSDNHLFPRPKIKFYLCHFSSDMEVTAAAETCLDGQVSEFFECFARDRAMG